MIVLDTHVLLWWQADGSRLAARAHRAVDTADTILVSPISFWEVGVLEQKGRIRLDRDPFVWVQDILASGRLEVAALAPSAAMLAGRLPGQGFAGDAADAIIYATAAQAHAPLVTKDQRIRLFAAERRDLRTIW